MNHRILRTTLLLATAGLLLGAESASAQYRARPPRPVVHRPVPPVVACDLQLEDAWGRPLDTYYSNATTWVLGEVGSQYKIRVFNRGRQRIEAVVSVDGRDVVSGDPSDYRSQRGYIVDPWSSIVIDGFRQSMQEVAAFRFTSPGDAYSSRMGTPQNTGIVGLACFAERQAQPVLRRPAPPVAPRPYPIPYGGYEDSAESKSSAPAPAQGAPAPTRSEARASSPSASSAEVSGGYGAYPVAPPYPGTTVDNLGTQYGESQWSPVQESSFVRWNAAQPSVLVTLRYDDAQGLVARGIQLAPPPPPPAPTPYYAPQAFPGVHFAPPPP